VYIEAIGRSVENFKEMVNNNNGLNISHPQIRFFKGENYCFGSIKMKTLFLSEELWNLVGKCYIEPTDTHDIVGLTQVQRD
jgi:hypothetical protein